MARLSWRKRAASAESGEAGKRRYWMRWLELAIEREALRGLTDDDGARP